MRFYIWRCWRPQLTPSLASARPRHTMSPASPDCYSSYTADTQIFSRFNLLAQAYTSKLHFLQKHTCCILPPSIARPGARQERARSMDNESIIPSDIPYLRPSSLALQRPPRPYLRSLQVTWKYRRYSNPAHPRGPQA